LAVLPHERCLLVCHWFYAVGKLYENVSKTVRNIA
jgi:hypothetical protein